MTTSKSVFCRYKLVPQLCSIAFLIKFQQHSSYFYCPFLIYFYISPARTVFLEEKSLLPVFNKIWFTIAGKLYYWSMLLFLCIDFFLTTQGQLRMIAVLLISFPRNLEGRTQNIYLLFHIPFRALDLNHVL